MWRGLLALLASVGQHHFWVVHRQPLVGVDSDAEETRVGLRGRERAHWLPLSLAEQFLLATQRKTAAGTYVDHPGCITLFEVVQHSRFVEVGHHGHVLDFIILGRVHGEDLIFLHSQSLTKNKEMHVCQLRAETGNYILFLNLGFYSLLLLQT